MNLSKSAGRVVAVAILIGLFAGLWLMLAQPLIGSIFEHRESIAHSQEMLAKYRRLAATKTDIDASLQKLHAAQQSEDRLLSGASTQLVGAKLQNSLKGVVEASGGALTSIQMLPAVEDGGFQRIAMAITLTATINSLQKIIYTIENQNPYLFIEDLSIQANQGFIQASDESEPQALQVHFEVYGYMSIQKHE
jgi:Type II secretion system (T2SS), protein M subtype b